MEKDRKNILKQLKQKATHLAIVVNNWDFELAGTYQVLANYIKELQVYVKPLEKLAKAISNELYK